MTQQGDDLKLLEALQNSTDVLHKDLDLRSVTVVLTESGQFRMATNLQPNQVREFLGDFLEALPPSDEIKPNFFPITTQYGQA